MLCDAATVLRAAVSAAYKGNSLPLAEVRSVRESVFTACITALRLAKKDDGGGEECEDAALNIVDAFQEALNELCNHFARMPWEGNVRHESDHAEMAAVCKSLLEVCGAAYKPYMYVKILNAGWQYLSGFLKTGKGFLKTTLLAGDAIQMLCENVLEVLQCAAEKTGDKDTFEQKTKVLAFFMNRLNLITKLFASSLKPQDLERFVASYCKIRACTSPCIRDPHPLVVQLGDRVSGKLDLLLSYIFESLYPATESESFLRQIMMLAECNETARLLGLIACIRSP
jgi:hypothetical protein